MKHVTIYSIYKITCLVNSKVYIGWTKFSPEKRWQKHFYDAMNGSQYHIHNAIRKYSANNFTIETICQSKDGKYLLEEMEPYFIKKYDSLNNGYNMMPGGQGGLGFKHSEKTKRKMSEQKLGKPGHKHTKEYKKKISGKGNYFYGKHHSKESNQKNRERHRKLCPAEIMYSNGNKIKIEHLWDFCKEHNLNTGSIHKLINKNSRVKSHKGIIDIIRL